MEEPFQDYGDFENPNNDKIVCVNITKTYWSSERSNIYECARKYWRLNGLRAGNADLVFAVCRGYVIGVFKPYRWFITDSDDYKYKGRWEFEGVEINDSPFLNMRIQEMLQGRQNPVMYINM